MSIPPQTIKVKRKRDDSESPVTFLQFSQEGPKRHRTGDENNWVYQRRQPTVHIPPSSRQEVKPVIHVSKPSDDAQNKNGGGRAVPVPRKTLSPKPSSQRLRPEPRRFHLSRSMMEGAANGGQVKNQRVSKKGRSGPAIFVERSKKKIAQKLQNLQRPKTKEEEAISISHDVQADGSGGRPPELDRKLKKPGTQRAKSPKPDTPSREPLPASASQPRAEDMDQMADDMNAWVLKEIGANLQEIEEEKKKDERRRFKPKVPSQRYAERHPESVVETPVQDTPARDTLMLDASDEDEDDWVIEEYIRVPAKLMATDVSPGEVGVLVLDGEDDDTFFFGPDDDEEDYLEDDEDENAENHYTADYPEDEVDSDDEYNRYAYLYRTGNASDNEEYDNNNFSDHSDEGDKMIVEGDEEFDHDIAMTRIKAYNAQRRKAEVMDVEHQQ